MIQRSSRLWRDSSVVRALVGIIRGPVFGPQLRCLNLSVSPSQCQCFLSLLGVLVWFNERKSFRVDLALVVDTLRHKYQK